MIANIWLASSIVLVTILSSTIAYNVYYKTQEAKLIQETYDIVSDIKQLIAKEYNKNPDDITRDEIIAFLPEGDQWERLFLLSRDNRKDFNTESIINVKANFEISVNDKLVLLALKAKLKNLEDDTTINNSTETETLKISVQERNELDTNLIEEKELKIIKEKIFINLSSLTQEQFNTLVNANMKKKLKKDLKKSINSLDLQIYRKIEAWL